MPELIVEDMRHGYVEALRLVLDRGKKVAPRGLETREVLGFQMVLTDPRRALAVGCGRKLHPGVAAAEALQLVGGFSDPAAMVKVSPHFAKYLDGGVLHAPYGPRVMPQMQRVVERLTADPSSRQAVVSIWDPVQDLLFDGSRDYPCTTHLQFMVRDSCVDLHVSMRANDAWHGFPYDVFQFAFLQCTLANVLGYPPGRYYHHATSFHLYEPQLEAADELFIQDVPDRFIDGVVRPLGGWRTTVDRARGLFYGEAKPADAGELYLSDALRKAGVTGSW